MRVTVRLVSAMWLAAFVVSGMFTYWQDAGERRRLAQDLDRRAVLLGDGLTEALEPVMGRGSRAGVERLVRKFSGADQSIAVYSRTGTLLAATPGLAPALSSPVAEAGRALATGAEARGVGTIGGDRVYVYASPVRRDEHVAGAVVVFLDASTPSRAERERWYESGLRFIVLGVVLSLIAWLLVRMSVTRPMATMAQWTKALGRGGAVPPLELPDHRLFEPMAREVSVLARSLHTARAAAEEEAALRLTGETLWTAERLKQFVKLRLDDSPLVVVSNREPLRHVWRDGRIETEIPASGLVTALTPVMRACGGIWIAQGSGDADPDVSDARGRLPIPPDDPRYTLRRVWLSKEEEAGYYGGFANEGLWPLCHIVYTRPQFRPDDWAYYRAVNEKFAAAVLEEIAGAASPMVLIQDFHFALVPALVKRERPDARTAIFWHIPWPNFEAFGICPWQDDLLEGMLGADIVGFHTQYYCNNFLETVDRALEARIDWEHFSVTRGRHATYVKPFPIGVAPRFVDNPPRVTRAALLQELGVSAAFLGVGVDRLDYTKGLPERFRALGCFFERFPLYHEQVVFVQVAAPSRSAIPRYQELEAEVEEAIREVNTAFQTARWRPIVYLKRHHEHQDIWPFYRHADFCMVTSLHDGMNLVAKEFVSVRDDGDGALILSRFAGASSELGDALVVNPYDPDGTAEAIRAAVEMPRRERRARMARMRQSVQEHNVYRWAGLLLSELRRIPEEPVSVCPNGRAGSGGER